MKVRPYESEQSVRGRIGPWYWHGKQFGLVACDKKQTGYLSSFFILYFGFIYFIYSFYD